MILAAGSLLNGAVDPSLDDGGSPTGAHRSFAQTLDESHPSDTGIWSELRERLVDCFRSV